MLSLFALSFALSAQAQDPDYRRPANWLCRPVHHEACTQNLDATVIAADGTRTIERFAAARRPGSTASMSIQRFRMIPAATAI
ncbi:hypothetical protein [Sphingomonas gei]|uniref:hypothetical protein n=1 Tax=Sphingomonas gei TaxID=1395960 RepID=UPI001F0DE554|nr:hypothetical protein [Sphingomonas gei]